VPCYHPWRKPGGDGQALCCGQCRGCRSAHAREWAMRCMHEASMHPVNSFVTLTYDNEHLPPGSSLDREAFPLFMKRLRSAISPTKVRYYHVGEYGLDRERPHYHALLFGVHFADQVACGSRGDFTGYRSAELEKLWPSGRCEVGTVSAASAAYLTGYVKRRITGSWAKARYGSREPEYGTMSRNPGIGAGWIDKYHCEVYPVDGVVVRGRRVPPPRYYDERFARREAGLLDSVKLRRFESRRPEDGTPERLAAAEKVAAARDGLTSEGRSL